MEQPPQAPPNWAPCPLQIGATPYRNPQKAFALLFKGVSPPPPPREPTQPLTAAQTGRVSDGGGIRTLNVRCVDGTSARAAVRRHTLPSLHGPRERRKNREPSERRRAPCASPFQAPPRPRLALSTAGSCVAPASFGGCYRCDEGQREKFVVTFDFVCGASCGCGVRDSSLVTAVRFWDRCLRRSMRGTCLSERRSGCRF